VLPFESEFEAWQPEITEIKKIAGITVKKIDRRIIFLIAYRRMLYSLMLNKYQILMIIMPIGMNVKFIK
jgi:hypothetical protein